MRRLPPLNALRAFEAAARAESFAHAATELHVTPAAISRMVRLLEDRLGLALFERTPNRLIATHAGRAYQRGLTPLFDALAALTTELTTPTAPHALTVGVGPTFAIRWLIPRLAAFRRTAPDIEIRITTGGVAAPFAEDWTCGITLGDGIWPNLIAEPLFTADLTPVCTPAVATTIHTPADLHPATMLRVAHSPGDWPLWLTAAGLPALKPSGPDFDYYGHALQAALDGLGIAMGIRPYIDDDLRAGRLVAPFPLSVPKGKGWFLVHRPSRATDPGFATFRAWLLTAATQSPTTAPPSPPISKPARRR